MPLPISSLNGANSVCKHVHEPHSKHDWLNVLIGLASMLHPNPLAGELKMCCCSITNLASSERGLPNPHGCSNVVFVAVASLASLSETRHALSAPQSYDLRVAKTQPISAMRIFLMVNFHDQKPSCLLANFQSSNHRFSWNPEDGMIQSFVRLQSTAKLIVKASPIVVI